MTHFIFVVVATLAMLPGIPLVFTPLPATLYMLLVALGFGFADGFLHLTSGELWILVGMFLLTIVIDQLSGIMGARYGGASAKSMLAGITGMLLGTFLLPPLGGMIGLFAGVALVEYLNHKNHVRALKAATGSFLGMLAGKLINAGVSLIFVILFIIFALT